MAKQSVTKSTPSQQGQNGRERGFSYIPIIDEYQFEVREGIDSEHALVTAACLAESIKSLATQAVGDGEMDAPMAYLVRFATDAMGALLGAAKSMPRIKEGAA